MEEDPPPGVPEWIVTYGDMMSLLLTFFIMLVSLSEIAAEERYMQVVEALHQYLGHDSAALTPPGAHHPGNAPSTKSTDVKQGGKTQETARGGTRIKAAAGDESRVRVTEEGTPERIGDMLLFAPESQRLAPDSESERPTSELPLNSMSDKNLRLTAESEAELQTILKKLSGKPNKIQIKAYYSIPAGQSLEATEKVIADAYERAHFIFALLLNWKLDESLIRITVQLHLPDENESQTRPVPIERVEIYTSDMLSSSYVAPRQH